LIFPLQENVNCTCYESISQYFLIEIQSYEQKEIYKADYPYRERNHYVLYYILELLDTKTILFVIKLKLY